MGDATFTPGPWRTHLDTYVEAGDNDIIAKVETRQDFQEQKATQRLIAAAPDMLDALRAVLLFHGVDWNDACREEWLQLTGSLEATTKVLCDTVRAAVAKAVQS